MKRNTYHARGLGRFGRHIGSALAASVGGSGVALLMLGLLVLAGPTGARAAPGDATPAPTSSGHVRLTVQPSGVVRGSTISVFLTGWSAPDGSPPTTVAVTTHDPANAASAAGGATKLSFSTAGQDGQSYSLNVKLPTSLSPGKYWLTIADASGSVVEASDPFQVLAAAPQVAVTAPSASGGLSVPALIGGIVLVLLAVGIVFLVLNQRQRPRKA
jgi:hypothetical protein